MNTIDPIWERLTASARTRLAQTPAPDPASEAVPLGFPTRVVALWRQTREAERRLALWQRLSWRAAFAAMAMCGLIAVAQRTGGDREALLEPPALDLPGFDSRS